VNELEKVCRKERGQSRSTLPHTISSQRCRFATRPAAAVVFLAAQFALLLLRMTTITRFTRASAMRPLASANACAQVVYIGSMSKLL